MIKEGNILHSENNSTYLETFGYHFLKTPQYPLYQLKTIGWQKQTSTDYYWDGMKRPDDEGHCIFQYTLSGFGCIEIDNKLHKLERNQAFLIEIPSEHKYYIPMGSEKWEFIFIHLYGKGIVDEVRNLQRLYGKIINFNPDSESIKYLWDIYWHAQNKNILDGFQTSAIAYQFVMELYRSKTVSMEISKEKYGESISNSVEYMKKNYFLQLNLDDIAEVSCMSKFHYNRIFLKIMETSPWNYLTKIRIEKAIELMQNDKYDLEMISKMVGFSSANYFNKVFRKFLGTSPGRYKKEHFSYLNYQVKI